LKLMENRYLNTKDMDIGGKNFQIRDE